MNKAVVLLSGGMDSLVTAFIAKKENEEIFLLHLDYGQSTSPKESECFEKITNLLKPQNKLFLTVDYFRKIGGSSLIGGASKNSTKNFGHRNNKKSNDHKIPDTYVPFRNANLISIAVSWAETIGANRIYIGAVETDSSGYPDCRKSFFNYMNKAIDFGTKDNTEINLITPLINLKKSEIVKLGLQYKAPFELSWSCYRNNKQACGKCDSCKLRIRAFLDAGAKDPIPYEINIKWNDCG